MKTLFNYILFTIFVQILYANKIYNFSNLSVKDGLSQLNVTCIYKDRSGYMWFGTKNGLNRYDGVSFKVYKNEINNSNSISSNVISSITEDSDGNLWIGTENGLNKFNPYNQKFKRYFLNKNKMTKIMSLCLGSNKKLYIAAANDGVLEYNPQEDSLVTIFNRCWINDIKEKNNYLYLASLGQGLYIYNLNEQKIINQINIESKSNNFYKNRINCLHISKNGNIWLGNDKNGILAFNEHTDNILYFNTSNGLSNNNIKCINESPNGDIWVGTFDGLNIIKPLNNKIIKYHYGSLGTLSHNSIYSVFFDDMENIWIGTYAGGINFYSPYMHLFDFHNPANYFHRKIGILNKSVEHNGTLYIGAEGGGLILFDLKKNVYSQYMFHNNNLKSSQSIIKTIFLDNNKILCGTGTGEIYSFDLFSKKTSLFYVNKDKTPIYHISRNQSGELMVCSINTSSNDGLAFISDKNGFNVQTEFISDNNNTCSLKNVICICEIKFNTFLIGTKQRGVLLYDKNKQILKPYNDEIGLNSKFISCIFKDNIGNIWIGTMEEGVYKLDINSGNVTQYNEQNGLSGNQICNILEDNTNNLWITSLNGISRLDLNNNIINNFNKENGVVIDEFSLGAGSLLSDNRIFLAGNNGFILFKPENIKQNPNIPPVVIDRITVNNIPYYINKNKTINLNYNQNNIIIDYCALNYVHSNMNQYSYKLEGFDDKWNDVENRHTAYYTNIQPGSYNFVVKASNNDNIWNNTGASVKIIINPPLWKTWWAYTFYSILFIGFIIFVIHYFIEKRRLKDDIKLKQLEAEVHEEFYRERNRLFTNFSHELRTPLTLIISPLQEMIDRKDVNNDIKEKSKLMLSNAQRLLRIVNNLMDLQKNESGALKLRISKNDIIKFTNEIIIAFNDLAIYRNINLKFIRSKEEQSAWFDWDLFEKVYFNFLSNAFKNVPNGGSITINLSVKQLKEITSIIPEKLNKYIKADIEYILVSIIDNGPGIKEDELDKIFQPFYQVSQNIHSKSGTGIGLSLSKAIIEKHGGIVWAKNSDTTGAIFNFVLPLDKSFFQHDDFVETCTEKNINIDVEIPEETINNKINENENLKTIIVVEDNKDLNNYICSSLTDKYKVIGLYNGEEALIKSIKIIPDLIITDLMMPKMDGNELVKELKDNINTCHIPIIMLTAKTNNEDIKNGYIIGVDEYITKPFDLSILKVRIDTLIANREKLKEIYSKDLSLDNIGIDLTPSDEKFMQNLYSVLKENLSNPELNIEFLCEKVGMSKSNLYRKIKQITDYSPNEFIRNFRLNIAAKMLKETEMTITEIYCAVGYNSLAYFSNSFKAIYGISPSEYKINNHK